MNLVFGHDATVLQWVERHGYHLGGKPGCAFGVIDSKGVLRGAFLTTWETDTTAQLHLFGRTSNDTWRGYFEWVFAQVHRLEIVTAKSNTATKRAAPKFGFKFEGVSKHYYGPGRDALRFYMIQSQCRWLRSEERHGQLVQIA